MTTKEFKLKQIATMVPAKNIKELGYKVCQVDKGSLFIRLPEGWISIDLAKKTFSVGAYEG